MVYTAGQGKGVGGLGLPEGDCKAKQYVSDLPTVDKQDQNLDPSLERPGMGKRLSFRLTNANGLPFRTGNVEEFDAAKALVDQGYIVVKRGWPDLIAVKGNKVRVVEVKTGRGRLKSHQSFVASVLSRVGLEVEIWPEGAEEKSRQWQDDRLEQG